jgi:phosphatidylserine/phosphatidylglycerophosphate/cardiolipin synthase-like enzyme
MGRYPAAAIVIGAILAAGSAAAARPIGVCFTPGGACAVQIVDEILSAAHTIHVQAYGFTSQPIIAALTTAQALGIQVDLILDHSDLRHVCDHAAPLIHLGAKIWIDHPRGIAHSKTIIIDEQTVVTGSYNFTASAEHRNAETVLFISDHDLAARFLSYWTARQEQSEPLPPCPS